MGDFLSLGMLSSVFYPIPANGATISERPRALGVRAWGLLPGGLLGDRYGRKKILLGALVLFGAGSLACAYAPSAGAFIAARVLLGLGAAPSSPWPCRC